MELVGIRPPDAVKTLAGFNTALADGSVLKWRGCGRKKYVLLCRLMDYPEPQFGKRGQLLTTPNDRLRLIRKGGK